MSISAIKAEEARLADVYRKHAWELSDIDRQLSEFGRQQREIWERHLPPEQMAEIECLHSLAEYQEAFELAHLFMKSGT